MAKYVITADGETVVRTNSSYVALSVYGEKKLAAMEGRGALVGKVLTLLKDGTPMREYIPSELIEEDSEVYQEINHGKAMGSSIQ